MTNLNLLDVMSEIDPALIDRAEAPVSIRKKPFFRPLLIAAAVATVLVLLLVSATVAASVAGVNYARYVEQNYPEYDGTVLHLVQILLTEDDNFITELLDEDTKQTLGGLFEALRGGSGRPGPDDPTEAPTEEQTGESETEPDGGESGKDDTGADTTQDSQEIDTEEQTTRPPAEDTGIFVHSSYDSLSMVAGEQEIDVFTADTYNKWRRTVEVTDPDITHLKFRGWLAFKISTPGTYGYSINDGEPVYDKAFSKEAEEMVHVVSSYMGGKSCSRMEILIPIDTLEPGEHNVKIRVKSANGYESNLVIFTVIIHEHVDETGRDEPPEQGWSEGLEFAVEERDGQTVCTLISIGSCTDTELYIPPTYQGYPVVEIASYAFFLNSKIESVVMPSTVTSVGMNAFSGNVNLRQVKLSENLVTLQDGAFEECGMLESIELPRGLSFVANSLFCGCSSLRSVTFLGEITWIGDNAFYACFALTELVLPDTVQTVGGAILQESGITHFTVPAALTDLPLFTFYRCQNLKTVTLHAGVTAIGYDALGDCISLEAIYFHGTPEQWEAMRMTNDNREQLTPLVVFAEK